MKKNNSKEQPFRKNDDLPFESPQNEESKRLSKKKSAPAIERKDQKKLDKGERRGGNRSVNQG